MTERKFVHTQSSDVSSIYKAFFFSMLQQSQLTRHRKQLLPEAFNTLGPAELLGIVPWPQFAFLRKVAFL
jgi:hypothetical protein